MAQGRFTPKGALKLIVSISSALCNMGSIVTTERQLQDRVREKLETMGLGFVEEKQAGKLGRLDFLVADRIVLELKIGGSVTDIIRQVDRYLESDDYDGALVVTTKRQHLRLPAELRGKPVRAVWVGSL